MMHETDQFQGDPSLEGLVVVCDSDARHITKRRPEDQLRKEFSPLKWQAIVNHGCGVEIEEAK